MSLIESVENIVVGALAQQDRFARRGDSIEPDSRVVTRDVLNAIADELNVEQQNDNVRGNMAAHYRSALWLRAQAKEEE